MGSMDPTTFFLPICIGAFVLLGLGLMGLIAEKDRQEKNGEDHWGIWRTHD